VSASTQPSLRLTLGPNLAPGTLIGGKYEVRRMIGRGGMGEVYEARYRRLSQRVALKLLSPLQRESVELRARLEQEASAVARLTSDHVVRVLDLLMTEDKTPVIVMEHLEGRDLELELAERRRLPLAEAVSWMLQACAALGEAHRCGIVHRDVKPSNLFLAERDGRRTLKVLDFGISKDMSRGPTGLTTATDRFGTSYYMSPEQIRDPRTVDTRSDVWSLGVIFYRMLTGRLPFEGETDSAVIAAVVMEEPKPIDDTIDPVPDLVRDAVMATLQKARGERLQSVEELAQIIRPYAAVGYEWSLPPSPIVSPSGHPDFSGALTQFAPLSATSKRRLRRRLLGAGVLAAAVSMGVGTWLLRSKPTVSAERAPATVEPASGTPAPQPTATPVLLQPAAFASAEIAPRLAGPASSATVGALAESSAPSTGRAPPRTAPRPQRVEDTPRDANSPKPTPIEVKRPASWQNPPRL